MTIKIAGWKVEIGWFYVGLTTKPYVSPYGIKAERERCVGLGKTHKGEKRFGYWNTYYDGYFHNFSLLFLCLFWYDRCFAVKD